MALQLVSSESLLLPVSRFLQIFLKNSVFYCFSLLFLFLESRTFAAEKLRSVTAQVGALAPNAGGQVAYSLKYAHDDDWEASLFSNQYILAGKYPLSGATYSRRFPVCDSSCFWRFFVQTGAGVSTGGPMAEITWGSIIPILPVWLPTSAPKYIPSLRIDFTSQFIFVRYRAVTWSYPLWVGLTVSF
jgi:hypothetical protein